MLRLAIDSATRTAAVALQRDGIVVAEDFCNNGLTHSQTLLPTVQRLLEAEGVACSRIDEIAVTVGPGSFTGVRIGISTAKGLAMGADAKVIGVSSLAAAAYSFEGGEDHALICPCFDARCNQVYNAMFERSGGKLTRLCEDRALTITELSEAIRAARLPVYVCGDGTELVCKVCPEAVPVPEEKRYITGRGVLRAAEGAPAQDFKEVVPAYLRLSQAQRERENRLKNETKGERK
ncbi:MAG: tRNA (adenosine(37)-N6)-threonylcarbamoyltransferase complex dimerization subunit type 1 TsaB [Clostridia bacterium]|nr:tRNA (adenosine(37)-N6)-threonylcarbamoyltransferase complex dimerization subunit type 1 TsaB [Clostridia bacterium]